MLTRQGYLKAMGIEVWTSRSRVPVEEIEQKAEAGRQSVNQQAPHSAAEPRLSDVEPRRSNVEPRRSNAEPRRSNAEPRRLDTSETGGAESGTEIVPRFRLALLHYETVGLCLSLEPGAELPRRLCDDIAHVLNGNLKAVRFQMLEWPMLSTSGVDQSLHAARQVVTQKFSVMPERVLVVGSDIADYFAPLATVPANTPGQVGRQSYLVVPSLAGLMKSGETKRALLSTLLDWRN